MDVLPEQRGIPISWLIVTDPLARLIILEPSYPDIVCWICWINDARTGGQQLWIVSLFIESLPTDTEINKRCKAIIDYETINFIAHSGDPRTIVFRASVIL